MTQGASMEISMKGTIKGTRCRMGWSMLTTSMSTLMATMVGSISMVSIPRMISMLDLIKAIDSECAVVALVHVCTPLQPEGYLFEHRQPPGIDSHQKTSGIPFFGDRGMPPI